MARHSFIVVMEVSEERKEAVKAALTSVLGNWLDNVSFITKKTEQVVSVSIITRIERPATHDSIKTNQDGESENTGDSSSVMVRITPTITKQSEDDDTENTDTTNTELVS